MGVSFYLQTSHSVHTVFYCYTAFSLRSRKLEREAPTQLISYRKCLAVYAGRCAPGPPRDLDNHSEQPVGI